MAEAQRALKEEEIEDPERELRARYPDFARQLLARKDEITGRETAARENLSEQVLTSPGDEADASVVDTSADYFLQLANSHQAELMEIRQALERLNARTYGFCEACGDTIPVERLRKLPYARRCLDCQSASERHRSPAVTGRPKPTL